MNQPLIRVNLLVLMMSFQLVNAAERGGNPLVGFCDFYVVRFSFRHLCFVSEDNKKRTWDSFRGDLNDSHVARIKTPGNMYHVPSAYRRSCCKRGACFRMARFCAWDADSGGCADANSARSEDFDDRCYYTQVEESDGSIVK
jgi:hypothetical protein